MARLHGALLALVACAGSANKAPPPASAISELQQSPVVTIQSYARGLAGIHAANPGVTLRIGQDPTLADEPVLVVEYPPPTGDPAGRDVWCDAENTDWTRGRAIAFQVKPAASLRLSLSFIDRRRVAYTTWVDLEGGVWQPVRVEFANIRPNPYFQPPDAKAGSAVDVSEVKAIGFAPQGQTSGRLSISRIVVTK